MKLFEITKGEMRGRGKASPLNTSKRWKTNPR